jgi:hypothetical protein
LVLIAANYNKFSILKMTFNTTQKQFSIPLLAAAMLLFSCMSHTEEQSADSAPSNTPRFVAPVEELTPQQQAAFDAFNNLQTGTDEMNHLYSTFAGIYHPCFPADTSFTISRAALLNAMGIFVKKHCTNMSEEKRNELAAHAVLAQEEYLVLFSVGNASKVNYEAELPMKGTWVLPYVLGRRDVLLEW